MLSLPENAIASTPFALLTPSTMHYRNGREAKNGDKVIQLTTSGPAKIVSLGILHDATPGNDFCNGSIAPVLTSVSVVS